MKKVSIVMPVYNGEDYLKESLDSVLRQTLQEWELLCVDDGSADKSLEILKQYQSKDNRIRVYSQPNQGAGVARNLGLQHAQGEYIAFLDADDYYYDTDALEKMYEVCVRNDVNACGSAIKLLRNGVVAEDVGFDEVKLAVKASPVLEYEKFQFDYGYYGFLFKTAVIRENGITFPMYRRFQDPPFFVKVMYHIKKFSFADTALYCYRTPNVAMRFDTVKTIDLLKGLIDNLRFAAGNNLNFLFERTLQRLEVEYGNIICHNISPDSTDILELLLGANQLVRQFWQKENYIVLPLQKILGSVSEAEKFHKEKLYEKISNCKRIYLYGAGRAATDILSFFINIGLLEKVIAIIVTDKEGNPKAINGIPVVSVDGYQYMEGDLILITVTSIYSDKIVSKLQEMQITAYELIDVGMLTE